MKLTELGVAAKNIQDIIFVGNPEPSGIFSTSDGKEEEYFIWKLKSPVIVRCSVDPEIEAFETDELYIRESLLEDDGWELAVKGKKDSGFVHKNWRADFSKGQKFAVFQETTIAQWARQNRGTRRNMQRDDINSGIRKRMEERRKAKKS